MFESIVNHCDVTYLLCGIVVVLCFILYPRRQKGTPNGPVRIPVLGNLLSLASKDTLGCFAGLRDKYGDVYGVYMGRELTVILNGYDVIHDALVKKGNTFSVRPRSEFHQLMFKDPGIVFANGFLWKQHRKFAQQALNVFGYDWTEQTMEERINDEISHFVKEIESYGTSFDIGKLINLSVANVIAEILFGERCEYDDPKFVACLHSVGEAARLFTRSSLLMSCLPWLKSMPGDLLGIDEIERIRDKPRQFLTRVFKRHHQLQNGEARDVLGLYNEEMKLQTPDHKVQFTETTKRALMGELLSAGSETTATCIIWIILYLTLDQSLQRKLQHDIDEVISSDRKPRLEDRRHLPLVEATILEGLRIEPVAPFSVPHAVHEDVNFRGFTIPKETTVLVNLHSVMKDPNLWPEPNKFKPQRFLDADSVVQVPKEFLAFSIGRRSCLGESLARMELFLYVTSLLQRFNLTFDDSEPIPTTEGVLGMTYSPKPFKIRATLREQNLKMNA